MKNTPLSVSTTRYFIWVSGLLFLITILSCKSKNEENKTNEEIGQEVSYTQEELMIRGKEISGQVNSTLQQALKKVIEEKGFEGAIGFCSGEAIPITDSIAQKQGVSIQRISHKTRNEQNKPSAEDLKIIERYMQISQDTLAKKMPVINLGENGNTFYAPIYVANSLCLNCHGTVGKEILPAVSKALNANYPEDQATGFKLGDFRGLVKIEF